MKHSRNKRKLGRLADHRMALLKNLFISLVKFGKVETTLAKAKELRPYAEKLITRGKVFNLNTRKLLLSELFMNSEAVNLVESWASKNANRNGGYLRIVKNGNRYGDFSKTAVIEFCEK